MLSEDYNAEHASNSLVTFVTRKCFAIIFFLPSCWVNSLLSMMRTKKKTHTRTLTKETETRQAYNYNEEETKEAVEATEYLMIKLFVHFVFIQKGCAFCLRHLSKNN